MNGADTDVPWPSDMMRIREWDPEEVCRWLVLELKFSPDVIKQFQEQGIDGDVLQSLSENDMRDDLGVSRLADRRRLGEAIRQLAGNGHVDT